MRTIGSYDLTGLLGRGGMGEVWTARHRLLSRDAAVKLIRPEALDASDADKAEMLLKRFEREARATSNLRSPHTVQVFDFGRTDSGEFWYAMELLEGLDLRSLVERHGPVSAERSVYLLAQACDSLGEAHLAAMIHRDLKPANLFTCKLGLNYDFVKVLDFGLVKASMQAEETQLTSTGVATGSPAFMPPEIVDGAAALDARGDIYSLGCVAYWLLTGQLVFEGSTALKIITAHINETPEPPSARSELPIPAALDDLVMACLAKDPAGRPQTVDALARALQSTVDGEAWTNDRAREWWQHHLPSGQPAASPAPSATPTPAPAAPAASSASRPTPAPPVAEPRSPAPAPAVAKTSPAVSLRAPAPPPTPSPPALAPAPAPAPLKVEVFEPAPLPAIVPAPRPPAPATPPPDGVDPSRIPKPLSAPFDAQRSEVIIDLKQAFTDGAMTTTELEERLELAENARNAAELDVLVRDLPGASRAPANLPVPATLSHPALALPDDTPAPPPMRIISVFSGTERRGSWRVPAQIKTRSFFGGAVLDFRDAVFTAPVTEIDAFACFGGLEIVVPPDIRVECAGHGIFGGFTYIEQEPDVPNPPTLRIKGLVIFGGVETKVRVPKKRRFLVHTAVGVDADKPKRR